MNYELAKELKEAGFQQSTEKAYFHRWEGSSQKDAGKNFIASSDYESDNAVFECATPTLSELIEACGENFRNVNRDTAPEWQANAYKNERGDNFAYGSTPEEAVACLWLALNKNP